MAAKKSFPLRINPDIYAAIEAWAGDELRSVNGHIEFLLREALKNSGRLPKKAGKQQTNPNKM
jgi:hypothetical protein